MTDKFKSVWLEIEQGLGVCCLHKKAAFNEVSGNPVTQLTLVTSAPEEKIVSFIGNRKVERDNNRFRFSHNGISIDLTTFCHINDLQTLQDKAFRHTLTVDSIGVRRDGKFYDPYDGIADIRSKTIRLTESTSTISESLLRRMMLLVADSGYTLDESVSRRLEQDKLFEKEGFRKKFCEVFYSFVAKDCNWAKAASLLNLLGTALGHRKAVVEYTSRLDKDENDKRFVRAYLFLIFALIKVSSREIHSLFSGDPMADYFDSICTNMQKRITSYSDYTAMKEKYGADFLELLFDVQEIWMAMENIPYKRPSEADFDLMSMLVSDESLWSDSEGKGRVQKKEAAAATDALRLEGTLDFEKALSSSFSEEDYDEPTEGVVYDEEVYADEEPEDILNSVSAAQQVQKKEVCVDDEVADEESISGFEIEGLEAYEQALYKKNDSSDKETIEPAESEAPERRKPQNDGVINHSRGHSSKVLMNGGE